MTNAPLPSEPEFSARDFVSLSFALPIMVAGLALTLTASLALSALFFASPRFPMAAWAELPFEAFATVSLLMFLYGLVVSAARVLIGIGLSPWVVAVARFAVGAGRRGSKR